MNKIIIFLIMLIVLIPSVFALDISGLNVSGFAFYEFEGDGTSETGNHTLSAVDSPTFGIGKDGNATNGTANDRLAGTNTFTFNGRSEVSLTGWFKRNGNPGDTAIPWHFGNNLWIGIQTDGDLFGNCEGTPFSVVTTPGIVDNEFHFIAYVQRAGRQLIYINDTLVINDSSCTYSTDNDFQVGGSTGGLNDWVGEIDAVYAFNIALSDAQITELAKGDNSSFFPFAEVAPPSVMPENPSFISPTPNDGNFTNDANPIINISHDGTDIGYYLYFGNNSILNETHLVLTNATGDTAGFKNYTDTLISSTYFYKAKVLNRTNNNFSSNTTIRNFTVDLESPTLVTDFLNDTFVFNQNLTGHFNFSDNIQVHSINISIDGVTIVNVTNINTQNYILNLSYNISTLTIGKHSLGIEWADGHTAKELGGDYDISNGLFNNHLKYDFYDNGNIKTKLKSKSLMDRWSSGKRKDRYIQILEPAKPSDTITLIEESDMPIYIAHKEGSYNDYWIIMGNHWKDYVLENEPNAKVSIKRINENKVEVTISGIKNKEKLVFNSLGDLNVETREYSFYRINMTETFDILITEGFEFNMDLDVDFGNIEFDISGITPVAILQWNNTNFTSTLVSSDTTAVSFRVTLSAIQIETKETIIHNWWFNYSTFTDGFLRTNNASQIASSINVDVCNLTFTNYTILNLTYFDEVNNEPLAITNAYQLTIFDGTFYYNQTGSFVNNVTSSFCTNLNPLEVTYNWDMWGVFTLSKEDYITRVLDIDEAVPIAISNKPTTNLSLFLIGTLNSSTVTYTWQTTSFEPIDGTMRIFKCNTDGLQDLIESTPIISGEATANIQLLLQTYSYDVIIGGEVFKDLESYSRCHVESTTARTFFVDVNPINIAPLIGLAGIVCTLEESSINNSVTMSWTTNPQQAGYVSGCIVADRRTIRGSVNVLDNCSIESEGFTKTLAIPVVDGNTYVVGGRLEQGNNVINCGDTVILTPGQDQGGLFGVAGLLAVIFLVVSLALIYSSDGEFMLAGGAIGLIVSWFLGILVFDWLVVSGIIFFFALIAVTGRYTRKR